MFVNNFVYRTYIYSYIYILLFIKLWLHGWCVYICSIDWSLQLHGEVRLFLRSTLLWIYFLTTLKYEYEYDCHWKEYDSISIWLFHPVTVFCRKFEEYSVSGEKVGEEPVHYAALDSGINHESDFATPPCGDSSRLSNNKLTIGSNTWKNLKKNFNTLEYYFVNCHTYLKLLFLKWWIPRYQQAN